MPGHEVPRASPQYQRMLEKLNNEVELFKLHVQHYHMSPAQFRRRTSMLGLPGEIYDKYDRIFRTCRVCSTSVPTPPRARITGLRASSFGDLILVDHEEIKFGQKAYLAVVIIEPLISSCGLRLSRGDQLCSEGNRWRPSIFHQSVHGLLQVSWHHSMPMWTSYSLA